MLIDTRKSPYAKVTAVPHAAIDWSEGFWKERFDVCADITVPHIQRLFEEDNERFHVVENFRVAANLHKGNHQGTPFGDGDFYKWMEAATYVLAKRKDTELEKMLDDYIALIAKAQQEDGYLSTKQIIQDRQNPGASRMKDINDFEVYNLGHLFTGACLYKRVTGKDTLLKVAERAADYLDHMYTEALRKGEVKTAVCPSHYMGCIELYRTTNNPRYLRLAEMSLNARDEVADGTDDNQDSLPLRAHRKIVGHGVRSTYLYAGVADLVAETGEEALKEMLDAVWENCTLKKLYINGGCGALYTGVSPYGLFNFVNGVNVYNVHQAFGYEYQLPNITAYNETCATLGNIMWNLRMFTLQPEAKYFDLIEKSMLNLTLASVSLDGNKFFYENMLRRVKELDYELMWPLERKEELDCFCCPPNTARFVAQSTEYAYMISEDSVYAGMYGANKAHIKLANGAEFTLEQKTEYPWAGKMVFNLTEANDKVFNLKLRIPYWVEEGRIFKDGEQVAEITGKQARSYIEVPVDLNTTKQVVLHLEMPVRLTVANSKVEEDINQVAVERGPLVYCIETPDAEVTSLSQLLLPASAQFIEKFIEIKESRVLSLETEMMMLDWQGNYEENSLYQTLRAKTYKKVPVRMIPYYAWDNRGTGEMNIWLPVFWGNEK